MRVFMISAIVISAALSTVLSLPQGSVPVPPSLDLLDEIFGSASTTSTERYVDGNDNNPIVKNNSCSSYADYGFQCVDHTLCKKGLIINDDPFDIRATNIQILCKGNNNDLPFDVRSNFPAIHPKTTLDKIQNSICPQNTEASPKALNR